MIPSIAPAGFSPAALAQALRDTVFVVQREPGWQTWIEALAAVSTIVVALGLLLLGFGLIFAALKVRQLVRKVEEQAQKLRVDLAPAIASVNRVSENVGAISEKVKDDAARLSETVTSANEALQRATVEAERRVGEFNALIGVVQEEAERLFIGGASAVRGLQASADTFRRLRSGELELVDEDEEPDDEDGDEGFEDGDETEIRVAPRRRGRHWLDD
ncbi:MAG TPA: hypothetical protein VFR81_20590 [Longimicrobium sp.]|nr:hypothetical protein [Longimicrobium sp.]